MRQFFIIFSIASSLLFLVSDTHAVEKTIVSGQVKDIDGKPLSNATVSIGDKSDFTDVDGRYRIKDILSGEQKIEVKKEQKVLMEERFEVKGASIKKDISIPKQ